MIVHKFYKHAAQKKGSKKEEKNRKRSIKFDPFVNIKTTRTTAT